MRSRKRPRSQPPAPAPETPGAATAGAADDEPPLAAPPLAAPPFAAPTDEPAAARAGEGAASGATGGSSADPDGELSAPVGSRGAEAEAEAEAEDRLPSLPFLTVGIAVPVGADESLQALLKGLPRDTGMAFVIALHDPASQGRLREQLAAATTLPVIEVGQSGSLQPDHIYVGAAGRELRWMAGVLLAEPPGGAPSPLVLDRFLRSLASDLRSHAIGVLLAGSDADGALGLRSIKGEGGIAIVEDESRARTAGMLRRPGADAVDLTVSAEKLGPELARIAAQLRRLLTSRESPERAEDEQNLLAEIYSTLRKATGVDFGLYEQTTLRRRISRRLLLQRIGSLAEYARLLQSTPGEVRELYEDMLLNVTRFFRDPDAFVELRNEVLPLGSSETIRDHSNLFVLIDKKAKLYAKNPESGRTVPEPTARRMPAEPLEPPRPERLSPGETWNEVELQRAADRIVLARFGPAGVIINERAEILQWRGHTSPFLELPPGAASLNLLRMVSENIARVLREGVQRAVADDIPVRLGGLRMGAGVGLGVGDELGEVTIEILPVPNHGRNPRCFLVLFIPGNGRPELAAKPTGALALSATPDDKDEEIRQLRDDLASTRLYLQSLLAERDVANQELIAANEEIQSGHQELQSVNEELYNRNVELGQTSNDLINLLNNITIPVLMLDSDLRIRQFTPIAERMMDVRSADVGRPIGEIRMNLAFDGLEALLLEVIETLSTRELEVQDRSGRWHLLRARPYRTTDNKIEGVVLVLVDIDSIRRSQQQLIEARDFAQAIIDSAQMPLAVLSPELRVKTANRAFFALCNLPMDEVDKRLFPELAARLWNLDSIRAPLEALTHATGPSELALEHETGGRHSQVIQISARRILADSEGAMLVAVSDLTARKQAERLMRREKERLEGRVKVTERALGRSQEELRALAASLFTAHEEERRRVSRELHDDLAQKVALLEMNTERLLQKMAAPELRGAMVQLRTQIAGLSDDLRRIAYQLHPAMLDDLGLSFALKSLVEEFGRREGVPVTFTCRDQPRTLPPVIAGSLYRIAQEALRNISKHAGKAPVRVQLIGTPRELRLQLQDQGRGFEPGEARGRGGMGIMNMEERARLCGGSFRLKARPGEGVTITVRVPRPKTEDV